MRYNEASDMAFFGEAKAGGCVVKIYTVKNRGNDFLMLSYVWAGERKQRMIRYASAADERKARAKAREIADAMHHGRTDRLAYSNEDERIMRAARDALTDLNITVDAACREYAGAREILDGTGTIMDAAEYFRRSKPAAVKRIDVSDAVEQHLKNVERRWDVDSTYPDRSPSAPAICESLSDAARGSHDG